CLEAVYWAVLRHTCLRPESQYAVFQDAFTIPTVVRPSRPAFRCLEAVYWAVLKHTSMLFSSMFESVVTEYLETKLNKNWSLFGILEFARSKSNPKLFVAAIDDFKDDLYKILKKYQDKCNVHVNAKNKASKILSNFDSSFSTAEVKQFIKNLEYHEEARINDQQENQIFIDQLRKTSSEKEKEREKTTRPLDAEEDDDHSYKRQCKDEGLPFWWRIIDLSDPEIATLIPEDELSELNAKFSTLLENWTTLEPKAERCLQSLEKLRTIGEILRPRGMYGAILELQKFIGNKKEQKASELDDLFGDEKEIDNHKEISPLTVDDHMNPDVAFIFDLIRFT
ncbi:14814_t:CDS:2, partial [Acaulospora colombiana]